MPQEIGRVDITIATGSVAQVSVAQGRRPLAIVGPTVSGDIQIPRMISQKSTLLSQYTSGPAVEAAAYALTYEVPRVLMVRTDNTGGTAGAYGPITVDSDDGTVTGDGTVKPSDDLEIVVTITTGFTVGVTGGFYTYSLDGGGKTSAPIAVGTATFIQLPLGGGKYNLTATDVWATGDGFSLVTTGPRWSSDKLVAAITALKATTLPFGAIEILGAFATQGEVEAVQAAIIDLRTRVKYVRAHGHFRLKTAAETQTAYADAFNALRAVVNSDCLSLGPSWYVPSQVNVGAIYVRPFCFAAAPRTARLREDISADSRTEWGSVTGQVRGADGLVLPRAVDDFDQELWTPLGGFAPRTWPDKAPAQIFAGLGITLAADDSDTKNLRVAQVLDKASELAYPQLADRVGRGLLPAPDNTLDRDEKKRIEGQVTKTLKTGLVDTKIAVSARYVLADGQVVIGTPPIRLTGQVLVRIKGYPNEFSATVAVDATPA
jgi:hypothetical protein